MFQRLLRTKLLPIVGRRSYTIPTAPVEAGTLIEVKKKNLKQSPLRMKFLAMLIRNTWVPDALAQLRFTPKRRAVDLAMMLRRATTIAQLNYEAIPEELAVKEIMVTKGASYKKLRIMGRGRTGIGMIRSTHVTIKVDKIDFDRCIRNARSPREKNLWVSRKASAEKKKEAVESK